MAEPWVAPDTQAQPGAAPLPPPGDASRPVPPVPAPAGGPPTGALRPLTVIDILDGGLRAWKQAPATMTGLAAVFVVPAQVLLGVLSRDAFEDFGFAETFSGALSAAGTEDVDTGFGWDLFWLTIVIQGIAFALVTAAVARVVTGWYTGTSIRFGDAVAATLRRSGALAVAWVAVHAVEGAFALLLLVPALVPMTWYAVTSAVIACESTGPWRGMRRSFRLCGRRFGTVLAVCVLGGAVDLALSSSLSSIGSLYLELDLPLGWAVNTAVSSLSLLVTAPFLAAAVTLLYLDLRVRTEGLDIELAAARRLPA